MKVQMLVNVTPAAPKEKMAFIKNIVATIPMGRLSMKINGVRHMGGLFFSMVILYTKIGKMARGQTALGGSVSRT